MTKIFDIIFTVTVAFIGHRKIEQTALKERLTDIVTTLIVEENAVTFLFGSRSEFNEICYDVVSRLKESYPNVRRVYVRAEYDYEKKYTDYLLSGYEETFFPDKVRGAGTLSYVVRNQVMVDMCDILVTYCDVNYQPPRKNIPKKSGTVMAMLYAEKKKKRIINLISQLHRDKTFV